MERACKRCSQPIVGRDKRAIFCSPACKETWYAERAAEAARERRAQRRCVHCGAEMADRGRRANTCSKECSVAHHNEIAKTQRHSARGNAACMECGAALAGDRRSDARYCSDSCKRKAASARWRERSPGYMRKYYYGLTPERYDAMLAEQDNRCAICRTDTPGGKGGWHVDHCHESEKVRGLLCQGCNLMLGHSQDDPARLRAAALYLERAVDVQGH